MKSGEVKKVKDFIGTTHNARPRFVLSESPSLASPTSPMTAPGDALRAANPEAARSPEAITLARPLAGSDHHYSPTEPCDCEWCARPPLTAAVSSERCVNRGSGPSSGRESSASPRIHSHRDRVVSPIASRPAAPMYWHEFSHIGARSLMVSSRERLRAVSSGALRPLRAGLGGAPSPNVIGAER